MQTKAPLTTARKGQNFALLLATIFAIFFFGGQSPKAEAAIVEVPSFQSGHSFFDNGWMGKDFATFTYVFRVRSEYGTDPGRGNLGGDIWLDKSVSQTPTLTLGPPGSGIQWEFTPETDLGAYTLETSYTRIAGGSSGDTPQTFYVPDGVINQFQVKFTIKSQVPGLVGFDFRAFNFTDQPGGDSTPDYFFEIPQGTPERTTANVNLNGYVATPEPGTAVLCLMGIIPLAMRRRRRQG